MEPIITIAGREDFAEMIQLADLTMPDRMNLHELKKYFELFPDLIFKATDGRQIVGFCCAGIDMYQSAGWLLFNLVKPEYQGKGLGKRLIKARLTALEKFPNLSRVLVTVSKENTRSIRALESFGFYFSHREYDYYGPGKDRDIFELLFLPPTSITTLPEPVVSLNC
ncbi:GNAT family N-acetyltransferase [Effusibacillus consociatus]|uniref:GNAT family N-acetyltransferase n=1 Tax=Effusibacillus consociatus TaxID=1117041 RepID=A0ABV9Q6K2_9BACL